MKEDMSAKISILGTEYTVEKKNAWEDAALQTRYGYCDSTTKRIVIANLVPEPESGINEQPTVGRLLRHEIIHGFLYESGLDDNSDWACDEELVDWIALQFPKLQAAFEQAECII